MVVVLESVRDVLIGCVGGCVRGVLRACVPGSGHLLLTNHLCIVLTVPLRIDIYRQKHGTWSHKAAVREVNGPANTGRVGSRSKLGYFLYRDRTTVVQVIEITGDK